MPKIKIDKESVIKEAAYMANTIGIENLSLKTLAAQLGVKSPSLYNHIDGFDDLKQQLMLYGWKELENKIIEAVIGLSGYDAIRAMCYAFHEYAIENQGVFSTMLWYNQFENEQMTKRLQKCLQFFSK